MSAVSTPPDERARKTVQIVLQALSGVGKQTALAASMDVSDATINRLKTEHLENFAAMLVHLGLKVVPAEHVVVDAQTYEAMTLIASRAMADPEIAQRLTRGDR